MGTPRALQPCRGASLSWSLHCPLHNTREVQGSLRCLGEVCATAGPFLATPDDFCTPAARSRGSVGASLDLPLGLKDLWIKSNQKQNKSQRLAL